MLILLHDADFHAWSDIEFRYLMLILLHDADFEYAPLILVSDLLLLPSDIWCWI